MLSSSRSRPSSSGIPFSGFSIRAAASRRWYSSSVRMATGSASSRSFRYSGPRTHRCQLPEPQVLSAKNIGLTIAPADITEEEFRVLELIEAERQEQIGTGSIGSQGPAFGRYPRRSK